MNDARKPVRRALISVYDKTGLVELASELLNCGVELVSTGSTATMIANHGLTVTPVEELTGFPEILDGRVKTLHPKIHAGLLADLRKTDHARALDELDIYPFELVIVNLYPFQATVDAGAELDHCVEQIDIGGPSMIRAAAKNYPSVAVIVNPHDYASAIEKVRAGGFTLQERAHLATIAFQHTAHYDVSIANWMTNTFESGHDSHEPPAWFGGVFSRVRSLRYGENPHQKAALYRGMDTKSELAQAQQLHGKEMSYNNYTDAQAAWLAAYDHEKICVAIIKHANPCGIAISDSSVADAHRKAHACDPVSAFGGVIAANRPITVEMAQYVSTIFTEVIIAPDYEPGAVEILSQKKNIRILRVPHPQRNRFEMRQIAGGLLLQEPDRLDCPGDHPDHWRLAAGQPVDRTTLDDLLFVWKVCRAVKSNAIIIGTHQATVGIGMGQVSRVDAARLAVRRAGDRARGGVVASDAFFPFPDGLEILANAGVKAIVQPGGSMRDQEVLEAAQVAGVTVYLTGVRHFTH